MNELPLSAECAGLAEKIFSLALRSQRSPNMDKCRSYVDVRYDGKSCELVIEKGGKNRLLEITVYPMCAGEKTTYKQVLDGLVKAYDEVRTVFNS